MPSPLIIGHRGASKFAPENTLSAFRLALESGADGIEFDVRLTKDEIPVVIHDDNLKRTGGKPDLVSQLLVDDLQQFDVGEWFHTNSFSGEQVPTLKQVFDLFSSRDSLLYLEMKCSPEERDRLVEVCAETLTGCSLKNQVVVECFDLAGIAKLKKLDPRLRTAALFEPSILTPPLLSSTRLIDKALEVGADEIALHHRLATERLVTKAIDAGLKVVVWTVDDPAWVARARSMGIFALISNDPASLVRASSDFTR